MISFIKGNLARKTHDTAYIEVSGVGFAVGMSATNIANLPAIHEPVEIFTYMQVREDALSLFGFLTIEEKELFLQLISVSGIGPKVALAALSLYEPCDLVRHITTQDITAISRIPGVGKKTASRIVLELQGSLDPEVFNQEDKGATQSSFAVEGAQEALLSMGFTSDEAFLALKGAPETANEASLLQYALKRLGK